MAKFNKEDDVLRELVNTRRKDVESIQKSLVSQDEDLESRGQARLASFRAELSSDLMATLDALDRTHEESISSTNSYVEGAEAKLASSTVSPEGETAIHPGLARGQLVAPSSLGWFTAYYGVLHWADGTVAWEGYNPGNIDLWVVCNGSGSGLFGTGSCSGTLIMDWWFTYAAPQNRNYGHTIWVPYHGFYIVRADDGVFTSKEANVRMDISAVGYQYNYKGTSSTNVFDLGNDNINVNDRFDGWRTMYYSDLLGADQAYLRVSASFYVQARGSGSTAQLNFNAGDANYMGVPWVYID